MLITMLWTTHRFPQAVYAILEMLPLYDSIATPGLLGSTLYDTLSAVPPAGATGLVQVNATQFVVDCGALGNASLGGFVANDDGVADPDMFAVHVGTEEVSVVSVPLGVCLFGLDCIVRRVKAHQCRWYRTANPSIVITSTNTVNSSARCPTFLIAATVNIADASGAVQSLWPINPHAVYGEHNNSTSYPFCSSPRWFLILLR
jgi:hypothetical protein